MGSPAGCSAGLSCRESRTMKKQGLIHPDLLRVLAQLGHLDELLICDAGFPIPPHVERIDLAYRLGSPAFVDVVETIVSEVVVDSAVVADQTNEELVEWLGSVTGGHAVQRVSHEELKKRAARTRAAVRTGEDTPYANVILVLGVAF